MIIYGRQQAIERVAQMPVGFADLPISGSVSHAQALELLDYAVQTAALPGSVVNANGR